MAKETVSPIERHVEKGVLALTALLFVGVVVKYLISSPNTAIYNARNVGPAQIYETVADEGKDLRDKILGYHEKVELPGKPKPESPKIEVVMLPSPVLFGPAVPTMQIEQTSDIELMTVLPPGKPVIVSGRSGVVLTPSRLITTLPKPDPFAFYEKWNSSTRINESFIVTSNWITVAATFDIKAQSEQSRENGYPPGRAICYLAGAELQRRERNWDGTYGEWVDVKPYAPLVLPELPYLAVEEQGGKPFISDEMRDEIETFARLIQDVDYRLELMRPMPPPISYGDWWLYESFDFGELDLLVLDDEVLFGEELGNCPYWDRYPKAPKKRVSADNVEGRKLVLDEKLDELEVWLGQGCWEAAQGLILDLERADQYFTDKQRGRRNKLKERALAMQAKAEREARERKEQGLPDPLRDISPLQVVWAHDTLPDSVISGKTYQYHIRALLYNNFAGVTKELKNSKDAELILLVSEWSQPSDDISIPYDSRFFLVGKKERDQSAKVDVFKWHEGIWVKTSFEISVGDPIGGKDYVRIGGQKEKTLVDFSTGAILVDLDFNATCRGRRERRGEIIWGDPKATVSMVYLDSAGKLHERLLDLDKRSLAYKEMKAMAARPAKPKPGRQ
ncbi:MAG: hypothetical protein KAV82_05895 [Phycisphaerae bacterium]|nr:hypothetical protein [Phycisphaerae bacterium]